MLGSLTRTRRLTAAAIDDAVSGLSEADAVALLHDWRLWARAEQVWPGDDGLSNGAWLVWLVLAGRGWGKTRTGAEAVREFVASGKVRRIALVGPTAADARDTMVEGESGLLSVFPPDERPEYEPSKRRVTFANGALATLYSAEEPERLRGPQHGFAWCDELRAWKYADDAWDNLQFGLRLGETPRVVATTTGKPTRLLRELIKREGVDVVVTRGHTLDNAAHLPPAQLAHLLSKYEGTTVGRQELAGAVLDEMPGALWSRALLDGCRGRVPDELTRIAIGVDPTVSDKPGDECGIVAAGREGGGPNGPRGHVLRDWSLKGSPKVWAQQVVRAYRRHGANMVVAEGNQGGALVREVLHTIDDTIPVYVVHASRGKAARAEPVVSLYEQGRVTHAAGVDLGALEDQLVTWEPGDESPDRLDALVWALTELLVRGGGEAGASVF